MKEIYSIITQFQKKDFNEVQKILSPKQKELFNAIVEEVKESHFPKFGFYVQKMYNMLPSNPKFRKNYQALFGTKKMLLDKLKEYIAQNKETTTKLPPEIPEEWKSFLWARHFYSKLQFEAAYEWAKKAVKEAEKSNDINLYIQARILYYFLSDPENNPPPITDITQDYEDIVKQLLVNVSAWIVNVYKPYAYHQEKIPRLLKKQIKEIKNITKIISVSEDIRKWIEFIDKYTFYLDNVIMNEYPDENVLLEVTNYIEEFLIIDEYHQWFPTPTSITKNMLLDMIVTFNIRVGNILNANMLLQNVIDTLDPKDKNPYYERFIVTYIFTLYMLGKFKQVLKKTSYVIKNINKYKDELLIRHVIDYHYNSMLFLGNWTKDQEKELVNYINRTTNTYNTYGRQLRLRDQALFFYHKKDLEGLNVVLRNYRNSYTGEKKWDALYDFCFILHKTLEYQYNKVNNEKLKTKIIKLIENYGRFPKTSAWVRNHHFVFLRENILPKLKGNDKRRSKKKN